MRRSYRALRCHLIVDATVSGIQIQNDEIPKPRHLTLLLLQGHFAPSLHSSTLESHAPGLTRKSLFFFHSPSSLHGKGGAWHVVPACL